MYRNLNEEEAERQRRECREANLWGMSWSPSAEGSDVPPTEAEERWHASICDLHGEPSHWPADAHCYEDPVVVKQRQQEFMLSRQGKTAWALPVQHEAVEYPMSRLRRNCSNCWHWISPEDDGRLRGGQWWCTGCYIGNFVDGEADYRLQEHWLPSYDRVTVYE